MVGKNLSHGKWDLLGVAHGNLCPGPKFLHETQDLHCALCFKWQPSLS